MTRPDYRLDGTDTSAHAALENRARRERLKDRVLRVVESAPNGATAAEIQAALRPSAERGSISRRLTDLRDEGRIVDSGERRNQHGWPAAIVWKAGAANATPQPVVTPEERAAMERRKRPPGLFDPAA